jgi:hypothetical protein
MTLWALAKFRLKQYGITVSDIGLKPGLFCFKYLQLKLEAIESKRAGES